MKSRIILLAIVTAIITSCSPTQYHVEREIVIDAPASLVFDHVNNHKMRDGWSPWEQMDPDMEKSYEGPESGVGAKYLWSGNDSVGTGTLEIVESVPNEYIKSTLTFTSPWESTSTTAWKFEKIDGGVKAIWSVDGELPGYLFWMGEEEMDEMMGKDFQKGLSNLKELTEEKANMKSDMPITEVEVEAMPIYYIDGETKISEMSSEFYGERYGRLMAYLGEDSENMLEMPLAIAMEWDEENDKAVIRVALACESDKTGEGDIVKGMTHEGKAVKCIYTGSYDGLYNAHMAIENFANDNELKIGNQPWEIYTTDPGSEPDTSKWITYL
jgi:effector-binding domain-containing protein/uncharacterized protein YndB with AHSA1/START domain